MSLGEEEYDRGLIYENVLPPTVMYTEKKFFKLWIVKEPDCHWNDRDLDYLDDFQTELSSLRGELSRVGIRRLKSTPSQSLVEDATS